MILAKIVAICTLVCFTFASTVDEPNFIVRMSAKPTRPGVVESTPDWLAKLRSNVESALTEGLLLAATGPVTSRENCQKVRPSVHVEQVSGPAAKGEYSIAFKVSITQKTGGARKKTYLAADEVVHSLDLINFTVLSLHRGIQVSYADQLEESGSGSGGSGESGFPVVQKSRDGEGLPVDDDDRDASGDDEKASAMPGPVTILFPSDHSKEPVTEVRQKDFEHVLRHCFGRHMDKFVENTLKSEHCVALHYLAKHTGSSLDHVAKAVNQMLLLKGQRHRCDDITSPSKKPPSVAPVTPTGDDRLKDGTATAVPSEINVADVEKKGGGGLQLALYIVIGLVSLALVVLAVNLVIFGVKRRQLKVAAVSKSVSPSPAPNNMYTTKIELDGQDSASVKLASDEGVVNPQSGGVQNQWEEEDGSSLEEKA